MKPPLCEHVQCSPTSLGAWPINEHLHHTLALIVSLANHQCCTGTMATSSRAWLINCRSHRLGAPPLCGVSMHSGNNVLDVINARRACARRLQYFVCLSVCLFVCYQSPGFFSRLHDKLDLPACSSLVFLDFQLTDFDKTVMFGR